MGSTASCSVPIGTAQYFGSLTRAHAHKQKRAWTCIHPPCRPSLPHTHSSLMLKPFGLQIFYFQSAVSNINFHKLCSIITASIGQLKNHTLCPTPLHTYMPPPPPPSSHIHTHTFEEMWYFSVTSPPKPADSTQLADVRRDGAVSWATGCGQVGDECGGARRSLPGVGAQRSGHFARGCHLLRHV